MKDETKKIENPGVLQSLPFEYWETCDARQGGVIASINEKGLRIQSVVDMYVGGELRIKVFFSPRYTFDEFTVLARIVRKDLCCEEGWESYEYELEFIGISQEDCMKLRNLLRIRQLRNIYS